MIAQARITSETTATVHLAEETVPVSGADLSEIREKVKQVFIGAAKDARDDLDVVIVEPDVQHHLRVEPTGRITPREGDDRPLHGPAIEEEPSASTEAPTTGQHAAVPGTAGSAGSPTTGPVPAVRGGGGRRRRRAAAAAGTPTGMIPAVDAADPSPAGTFPAASSSPSADSVLSPGSAGSAASAPSPDAAPSPASAPSASSAPSAASAGSASSAGSAGSAASAGSAPSAGSAASAPSAHPAPSASSAPSAASAPSASPAPTVSSADDEPPTKRPLPSRTTPVQDGRPTLKDLQTSTAKPAPAKATRGVPGLITRLTRGVISPKPNRREQAERARLERIRRPLDGPRNIAVVNLKGGAHKTTASLMIAATLGVTRGGNVLAWDNNETRGTLGWRGLPTDHHRTAVDLLHDIDRLRSPEASNADLDPYVRPQGEMRFDILASDEDPGSAASVDGQAFGELNRALSRFYRIKVIDTGNNVRASNWLAAVKDADQLVIISTVREDTFNAAAWMIDELRATGLEEQVENAVTVLSHSSKGKFDPTLRSRLLTHFGAHTRAVTEVPFEKAFVDGSHLDWQQVSTATKEAWLDATALIIDGL